MTAPVPFSPEWYADDSAWRKPSRFERAFERAFNSLIETFAFIACERKGK